MWMRKPNQSINWWQFKKKKQRQQQDNNHNNNKNKMKIMNDSSDSSSSSSSHNVLIYYLVIYIAIKFNGAFSWYTVLFHRFIVHFFFVATSANTFNKHWQYNSVDLSNRCCVHRGVVLRALMFCALYACICPQFLIYNFTGINRTVTVCNDKKEQRKKNELWLKL